jgi:hypothetical protein
MKESNLQDTNLVLNGDFEELGGDVVTNGDFTQLPLGTGWSTETGWEIVNSKAVQDGSAAGVGGSGDLVSAGVIFEIGKTYLIQVDVVDYVSGDVDVTSSNISLSVNGDGSYYAYYTAATAYLHIRAGYSDFIGSIDNISIKEVDPNNRWTLSNTTISNEVLNFTDNSSAAQYAHQDTVLTEGNTYKITLTLARTSGRLEILAGTAGSTVVSNINSSGTHTFTFDYTGIAGDRFFIYSSASGNFIGTVDNVSIQEIKTATPRVDFTDNTDGRLLLEPQRTNLITYSEDLNTSFPLQSGTVVDSTNNLAPDGINTAYEITSTGGGKLQSNSTPLSANTTYTLSFYAKNIDATEVNSRVYVSGSTSGGLTSVSYISQINTSTWTRIEHVFTTSSATTGYYLYLSSSLNSGGTVQVWGAQLEQGSYATSYIPTSGSTVTRAADTCSGAGTSQDFNSTEGVLFVEMALLSDEDNNKYISISDGTDDNKIHIDFDYSLSRLQYVVKNETDVQVNLKLPYTGTNMDKIAVKWKVNDFAVWLNGVEIGTDTSGLAPIGLNTLNFSSSGSNHFQGKVKQLQVYKEALNSTRLIHLTGELGTDFYESYAEMASALTYTIQ